MDFNFDFDFGTKKIDFNSDDKINDRFVKLKNAKITTDMVDYSNASELAKKIKIQRGETVFCNLNGKFVFGDFIGAFIQENNLNVEELTVISLSGGVDNFEMLEALIVQGWVKKVNLVLSEYFIRTETAKHTKTISLLNEIVDNSNGAFKIYYTNTHAKIVLIKTSKNGNNGYVTMQGSANLRSSQSLEQLIIHENKELYDFNYQYFQNLI